MIIDAHCHMFPSLDVFQKSWIDALDEYKKVHLSKENYELWKIAQDGTVEHLLRDMDEAGVDKAVAIATSPSIAYGQELPKISIWEVNEYVAECQRKYPDRIVGIARVDPFRKDVIELLVNAVTEMGLNNGVKIHPTIPMTDELVQPLFAKINELEVPVIFHMGTDPVPFLAENGNPVVVDTLSARFPKIKFIASHYARGFDELLTGIMWGARRGRVFTDLALWQNLYFQSPWEFLLKMRSSMDKVPDSIMMGTDWPFTKMAPLSYKEWFDVVRNMKIPEPFLQLGLGMKDFTQEEKDMILGDNARAIYNI